MSTANKNLSEFNKEELKGASALNIGLVTAEWNKDITGKLHKAAVKTLKDAGLKPKQITEVSVPGAFELTSGTRHILSQHKLNAVICIGCVIQGNTPHFDYICQSVTQGITSINAMVDVPVIFGVLTVNDEQQAKDRAGGKHGNKGVEAAVTAIKMALLKAQGEGSKIGF
ncbi:MAG: 6,7-dimethyl-8-ribityllumazine synthase [Bacteroidia bacterium]|nr:6,7-dimethyl-8-ribityllumazine synthase [Bacteroidia bacterium]